MKNAILSKTLLNNLNLYERKNKFDHYFGQCANRPFW